MTTVDPKKVLKSGLVGFALGLLFMLGIGFIVPNAGAAPPAAATSTR